MRLQNEWVLAAALFFTSAANADAPVDSGALDPGFGSAGKVQLASPLPAFSSDYTTSAFVAQGVALQPDGKVVLAGYNDFTYQGTPYTDWTITRLNGDGSVDTGFGAYRAFGPPLAGYITPYLGDAGNRAVAVAVRPDGRIVVAGNILDSNDGLHKAVLLQFDAAGNQDMTFGNNGAGATYVTPLAGDATYASRIVIESDGSIDLAGTYYDNQSGFNGNQFFLDRIAENGASEERFQYEFGSGPNQDDHALDLAIDGQGRYVLVGYHRGSAGNYDCALIRIRADLSDVDPAFGAGGQTTVAFDYGGDNGDFCDTIAIFASSGNIAIGGRSSVDANNNQRAVVAMLLADGALDQYGTSMAAKFAFTYGGVPDASTNVSKLIIDNNDTKSPTLLAVGTGARADTVPYGDGVGVARLTPPFYTNFAADPTFSGGGSQNVYFFACPTGFGLTRTDNDGFSASYLDGKLVVAGDTACASGGNSDIAVARFAPFDQIFKNGVDIPSL